MILLYSYYIHIMLLLCCYYILLFFGKKSKIKKTKSIPCCHRGCRFWVFTSYLVIPLASIFCYLPLFSFCPILSASLICLFPYIYFLVFSLYCVFILFFNFFEYFFPFCQFFSIIFFPLCPN